MRKIPNSRYSRMQGPSQRAGMVASRNHEPSLWLRARTNEVWSSLITGDFTVCGHLEADQIGVAVLVTTLWDSHHIACLSCAGATFKLEGDADKSCDRCGRTDPARIHGFMFAPTPLLHIHGGLCEACNKKEV